MFVATRAVDVSAACRRYLSVDGSVPGALCTWDHHVTGEDINLDAMPDSIDLTGIDGVGTTLADTDALASVVAVLLGGRAYLPPRARAVLEAASHRCDHLLRQPDYDGHTDRLGARLHAFVSASLARQPVQARGSEFARLCRLVARRVMAGRSLPGASPPSWKRALRLLAEDARVRVRGPLFVADLRGLPPERVPAPDALYAAHPTCIAAVFVSDHRVGGTAYTVGRNPLNPAALRDIGPVLAALAKAEFAHGPPAELARPGAASENWGGRREVGGSPWNYGSRLSIDTVVGLVEEGIG
ncbi:MAG: hypothetical protein V4850_32265 [Myxococcota bacterium]